MRSRLEITQHALQAAQRTYSQCVHARDVAATTALERQTALERILRRQQAARRYNADETLQDQQRATLAALIKKRQHKNLSSVSAGGASSPP